MRHYRVQDSHGTIIVHRVTREQINRLLGRTGEGTAPRYDEEGRPAFNPALVEPHRRQAGLFIALVPAFEIHTEIRREVRTGVPLAEANRTIRRKYYSTSVRSGTYFEHKSEVIYRNYGPALLKTA